MRTKEKRFNNQVLLSIHASAVVPTYILSATPRSFLVGNQSD